MDNYLEKNTEIGERVRFLRKHLKLDQSDFSSKLAMGQGHLSNIENGKRDVPDKLVKLICLVFNVNEEWLKDGIGEMFMEISEEEQVSQFLADVMQGRLPSTQRLIKKIALLDDSEREEFEKLLDKLMSE